MPDAAGGATAILVNLNHGVPGNVGKGDKSSRKGKRRQTKLFLFYSYLGNIEMVLTVVEGSASRFCPARFWGGDEKIRGSQMLSACPSFSSSC